MWQRVFIAMLGLCVAACGGPPQAIIGVDNPAVPVETVEGATPVDLLIITSRSPDDNQQVLFSGERNGELSFASVRVFVPPERMVGEVNRARTLPPDPRRHFVVREPTALPTPRAFGNAVDSALRAAPSSDKSVLLFVHGFNTDLSSAIVRTAQFVHDSGFQGVPVLFSWPSRGGALNYIYDVNSTLHSRDALVDAALILRATDGRRFDVLAHSMGALLTVEAMRTMALEGQLSRRERLGNVILAAPDIDIDVFAKQLATLPLESSQIWVMLADNDRALALSRRIAGGVSRLGNANADQVAGLGVTVIDVSDVESTDRLQHSQFASAPRVVELAGQQLGRGSLFSQSEQPADGLRSAILEATLIPARLVGGGRVLVVSE